MVMKTKLKKSMVDKMKLLELIEKKIFGKNIYHRDKCRKEGRCIVCGRYIYEGCNASFNGVDYGYCMECIAKSRNYENNTVLAFRPLFRFGAIKRFEKSCNNQHYDYGEDY